MNQIFFRIKNIKNYSFFNKIIITTFLALYVQEGNSWSLFGYDNYEDCLSKEMKGRDIKQRGIVEDSCIRKFPKLASFTNKNKVGELKCSFVASDGTTNYFIVSISKNVIKTYLGEFKVLEREEEFIRGENKDKQVFIVGSVGAYMVINFYTGYGSVGREGSTPNQTAIMCHE